MLSIEYTYTRQGMCCSNCLSAALLPPRDINKMVWGVDLVEEHLLASCGLPAKPPIAKKPLMRVAEYSINAPATGRGWGGGVRWGMV